MNAPEMWISHMGETAVLIQSEGPMSLSTQGLYWALDRACTTLPEVAETVPGVHSLLVRLIPSYDPAEFVAIVNNLWDEVEPLSPVSNVIEIPVDYGGAHGADIAHVARHAGLPVDEVVRLHAEAEYVVYALGSQPGFAYLGGLDPVLATPRRDIPRISVPEGSVVIGGTQAGVISRTSPSGWNVIGHSNFSFFDPENNPPAVLTPGDRLRFKARSVP